jgi:hypothetical protein
MGKINRIRFNHRQFGNFGEIRRRQCRVPTSKWLIARSHLIIPNLAIMVDRAIAFNHPQFGNEETAMPCPYPKMVDRAIAFNHPQFGNNGRSGDRI